MESSVISEEQLKAHLMSTDDHFRQLVELHHSLDDQIAAIEAKNYLTEQDEVEEARLKKLKLRTKDEMQTILHHH